MVFAAAILTALTLKAVFRLALRQTEGLIGSIIELLGLSLAVPTFSTLSRRAETLEVPRPRSGSGAYHDADSEPLHLLAWFRIGYFWVTRASGSGRVLRPGFGCEVGRCGRRSASPDQARCG